MQRLPATLDATLAQAIVDRTMRIIECNVNVMDHRGIIIASGERARIGSLHEGATLVLAQGRTVEIDAALAARLHDARQGINLPLRTEGGVVGVVGISGEPEAIRHYAELVRMAAETMLEQSRMARLLARDTRLREELVLQMVGEIPSQADAIASLAKRIGIDVATPRAVLVILLCPDEAAGSDVETRLGIQNTVLDRLPRMDPALLAAPLSLGKLVVLIPVDDTSGMGTATMSRHRAEALCVRVGEGLDWLAALGSVFAGPERLIHAYRSADATLRLACRMAPGPSTARLHHYAEFSLAVLLAEFGQGWQAEALRRPATALQDADRGGTLRITLKAWFAERMNTAATARTLGVHRNTLDQRLQRIETITGLSTDTMQGALELYLALQLTGAGTE